MKKINVLHIVHTFAIGGLEHGVVKLANNIDTNKFTLDILSFHSSRGNKFPIPSQTKLIHFDMTKGSLKIIKMFRLVRLIRNSQYHIVHTHNWGTMPYGTIAAKIAGLPILVHGEHSSASTSKRSITIQRLFSNLPDHFVAICKPLSEWMEKNWHVPKIDITYIPNGVDIKRFIPSNKRHNKGPFTIGCVGRIEKVKNFPLLLRAFRKLIEEHKNNPIKLMIVGEGSERRNLEHLAGEMGLKEKITFTGETDTPEEYYQMMDLYINPNTNFEGMNNCILEAMACGVPVISSDLPENRSWLKEDENALFFDSQNGEDLVGKMKILLNNKDLRARMSRFNITRVQEEFTIEKYVRKHEELYTTLIGV